MSFIVKGQDGTTIAKNAYANNLLHDVAILAAGATGVTLTIRGKKPGSQFFEEIPDPRIIHNRKYSLYFHRNMSNQQVVR